MNKQSLRSNELKQSFLFSDEKRKKTLFILIMTIFAIALFVTIFKVKTNLMSPVSLGTLQAKPTPTPLATPVAPKTFKFGRNTDLKLELEKVDPQVLDSDFN